jgi:hypothetical protein
MLVTPLVSQTSARGPFSHLAASDMPSKKIETKNRNGKWNEHRVDARDAGSTFRIAQPPRRAPTHFNATGTSTVLRGNALELIDSQRDIRADLIGGTILGTTPHAMACLKLGIMYDVHLYIGRSTLIFAEERTKWNFLVVGQKFERW